MEKNNKKLVDKYDESYEEFYGAAFGEMVAIEQDLNAQINIMKRSWDSDGDRNPIEHFKSRIKSPNSMREKLNRKELDVTAHNAVSVVHDAIGVRIVCTFVENVYEIIEHLKQRYEIVKEKDYIKNPKPNGYRSYHMILHFAKQLDTTAIDIYVEIQLRTIAMDCWASLEHQLKYKQEINNQKLIIGELKRCADTMASADLMMQTIKEMIDEG